MQVTQSGTEGEINHRERPGDMRPRRNYNYDESISIRGKFGLTAH